MIKENAGLALTVAAVALGGYALYQWRAPAVGPYVAEPIGPGVITKKHTVSTYEIRLGNGKTLSVKEVPPAIEKVLTEPTTVEGVECSQLVIRKSTLNDFTGVTNPKECKDTGDSGTVIPPFNFSGYGER